MKKSDVVDILKEQARRAANRHKMNQRFVYLFVCILIFGIGVYFVNDIPEQNFVEVKANNKIGDLKVRGDYTNFWTVTENEPPHRDLFQGWPQQVIAQASSNQCGDKFAILVHEPHSDIEEERQLFYLLWYLQRDHPNLFSELVVFQEGSAASPLSNRGLLERGNLFSVAHDKQRFAFFPSAIDQVYGSAWAFESEDYAPANAISEGASPKQIARGITRVTYGDSSSEWAAQLLTNVKFHSHTNPNGSVHTQGAFRNLVEDARLAEERSILAALETLEPGHANLAEYLLSGGYLRAAFAYELFAEGYVASNERTVDVFGIEDVGLYGTSCKLQTGCSKAYSERILQRWSDLQPFRRAVMANNILRVLRSFDDDTIPVIAASIHSHLVDIRGYLCDAGYNSVGLTPTKNVQDDLRVIDVLNPRNPYNGLTPRHRSGFGTTPLGFPTIDGSILDILRRAKGRLSARP